MRILLIGILLFSCAFKDLDKQATISVYAKNLKTNQLVYSLNEDKLMTPASLTKLFTSFAALKYLSGDYRYITKLGTDGKNLYIKFVGDPSFTKENLDNLMKQAQTYKFENIIIDDTNFDDMYYSEGSPWDDQKFAYSAQVNSIIIDGNHFQASLSSKGITKTPFAKITNNLIIKNDKNCAPKLKIIANKNHYLLHECLHETDNLDLKIAYQDMREIISKILGDKVKFGAFPANVEIIAEHKSHPLKELIKILNKVSDNLYGGSIIKTLGANYYKTQGTFENGTKAMRNILKENGIDPSSFRIVDGAGSSHYNLVSAKTIVHILELAASNKDLFDSLAIYGIDGTLKYKTNKNLIGKIHAKTGGLKDVTNIAGYKGDIAFAIMITNFIDSRTKYNDIIDKIMEKF